MTVRLVLIRHAQTDANARHVLDSRPPGAPLNAEGRRQARELARRLAGEPLAAVYASVATRAQQTARELAGAHGLPVVVLEGVHEVDVGDLEGRSDPAATEQLIGAYRAWHAGNVEIPVPGGESGRDVLDRFLPVVEKIRADHAGGATVALVSHSAAIRLVARTLASNVDALFADAHLVPNAGAVVLELDGAGWHCVSWDGVATRPPHSPRTDLAAAPPGGGADPGEVQRQTQQTREQQGLGVEGVPDGDLEEVEQQRQGEDRCGNEG